MKPATASRSFKVSYGLFAFFLVDVFEPIFKDTGYRGRWGIDHAETITPRNIARIESVLMVTGGDVVYAAAPFTAFAPEPLPAVSPARYRVAAFGGYQQ